MTGKITDWHEIRREITSLLNEHSRNLTPETIKAVQHYINHDEYEMALEGLCLDLMEQDIPAVNWPQCQTIAQKLNLDKETVFDPDFWNKLRIRATT